ncbi:hypothetical protein MXAZACID_07970, partial [Acidocella sp. MX-AZ02]
MPETLSLLRFLLEAQPGSVALLSVTATFGGGARAVGAQMAVRADGAAFGTLSGGCVEAAIIGEARRVIASGRPESIRIGQGSRMMDLRLPCGGGMDVLITPLADFAPLRQAHAALQARQEVTLRLAPKAAWLSSKAMPAPAGRGQRSRWRCARPCGWSLPGRGRRRWRWHGWGRLSGPGSACSARARRCSTPPRRWGRRSCSGRIAATRPRCGRIGTAPSCCCFTTMNGRRGC